jgi:hypothetical protein
MNEKRWGLLQKFDVKIPGDRILLRRWRVVLTPLFGVYVHELRTADPDRDCHDHPWTFRSWVLSGGYVEEVREQDGSKHNVYRHRGSIHTMPLWRAHRIKAVQPNTVTLVIVGRRRKVWGFFEDSLARAKSFTSYSEWFGGTADSGRITTEWIPWTDYVRVRGLGPDPFDS